MLGKAANARREVEDRFFGRVVSPSELELVKEIVNDFPSLNVTELSRTIRELLEWKRPSGG